jgi:hypothetical protein
MPTAMSMEISHLCRKGSRVWPKSAFDFALLALDSRPAEYQSMMYTLTGDDDNH